MEKNSRFPEKKQGYPKKQAGEFLPWSKSVKLPPGTKVVCHSLFIRDRKFNRFNEFAGDYILLDKSAYAEKKDESTIGTVMQYYRYNDFKKDDSSPLSQFLSDWEHRVLEAFEKQYPESSILSLIEPTEEQSKFCLECLGGKDENGLSLWEGYRRLCTQEKQAGRLLTMTEKELRAFDGDIERLMLSRGQSPSVISNGTILHWTEDDGTTNHMIWSQDYGTWYTIFVQDNEAQSASKVFGGLLENLRQAFKHYCSITIADRMYAFIRRGHLYLGKVSADGKGVKIISELSLCRSQFQYISKDLDVDYNDAFPSIPIALPPVCNPTDAIAISVQHKLRLYDTHENVDEITKFRNYLDANVIKAVLRGLAESQAAAERMPAVTDPEDKRPAVPPVIINPAVMKSAPPPVTTPPVKAPAADAVEFLQEVLLSF